MICKSNGGNPTPGQIRFPGITQRDICPMNSPLRFNDALLITDRAFKPFHCVAWTLLEGNGELSITVVDDSESAHWATASYPAASTPTRSNSVRPWNRHAQTSAARARISPHGRCPNKLSNTPGPGCASAGPFVFKRMPSPLATDQFLRFMVPPVTKSTGATHERCRSLHK